MPTSQHVVTQCKESARARKDASRFLSGRNPALSPSDEAPESVPFRYGDSADGEDHRYQNPADVSGDQCPLALSVVLEGAVWAVCTCPILSRDHDVASEAVVAANGIALGPCGSAFGPVSDCVTPVIVGGLD